MESKARLLSRIRPGKASPKKIRGFMALPGEVRNQIYNYYFQEAFRCEIAAKESHIDQLAEKPPSETIKLCVGVTRGKSSAPIYLDESNYTTAQQRKLRVSRHWGNSKHVQGLSTKWETSLCPLILVCKQIHRETIVFLYQNTTFVFDSPKRITSFFKWVPSRNLVNVTKLQLYYVPQLGDPGQLFEGKHQVAWSRACKGFTKKMGNLQDLTVIIYTAQHVRWFDLRQSFIQPLLQFRRLSVSKPSDDSPTSAKALTKVKVHFSTYWSRVGFTREAVTDASNHLHRLYAQAIEKAILGASEEEAMKGFFDAWEGRYAQWKHHLQYNVTGW